MKSPQPQNITLDDIINSMIQKPQGIEISLHKIYAEDGLEFDSLLFEPKHKTKKIVIHIHGKEGHFIQNHFITHMGYSYPQSGFSFVTFNNRGHDYMADMLKRSTNGFEWETHGAAYEEIEKSPLDINGVIEYVKRLGYEEVILQGHSLGPHKISYYLSTQPKHEISKVILLSTADFRYLLETTVPNWREHAKNAEKMITNGHENDLMPVKLWSNSPVSAKTFWHYTKPDSNTWIFNFSVPNLAFKHFNAITIPILVVLPENDFGNKIPAKESIRMLKEQTASKDFTGIAIQEAVHNFASKENELVEKVLGWLTR